MQPLKLLDYPQANLASLQLAEQGNWEICLKISDPKDPKIENWLTNSNQDVAIEAVFHDAEARLRGFIGFRRFIESPTERAEFWPDLIQKTLAAEDKAPNAIISLWRSMLGRNLRYSIENADWELGVFNRWKSDVPMHIRKAGLALGLVNSAPHWYENGAPAPICLELVWENPESFWIASDVSTFYQGRYWLDPKDRSFLQEKADHFLKVD
jgi:hypothetical protein